MAPVFMIHNEYYYSIKTKCIYDIYIQIRGYFTDHACDYALREVSYQQTK